MPPSGGLRPNILDFHQVISGMGDHGGLLRALGLVVELTVPLPSGTFPATVRLVPAWTPKLAQNPPKSATFNVMPYTMLDPTGWPAPRLDNTRVTAGHLQFELEGHFTPVEVDTEGAGLKLLDLARTLWSLEVNGSTTSTTSPVSSLPALRQGGLSVAQLDRAWALANPGTGLLGNAESMNAGAEATPSVDPIVGPRTWPEASGSTSTTSGGSAGSNCAPAAHPTPMATGTRRAATCWVRAAPGLRSPSPKATKARFQRLRRARRRPGPSDLYLHETLFHWTGWSLVGARPGKTLARAPIYRWSTNPPTRPLPIATFLCRSTTWPHPGASRCCASAGPTEPGPGSLTSPAAVPGLTRLRRRNRSGTPQGPSPTGVSSPYRRPSCSCGAPSAKASGWSGW